MTTGEVLAGLAVLAVMVAPVAFGASRLRRRLLPGWHGPDALLVDIVLVLAHLTLVSELLGSIGLFERPVVAVSAAVSGVVLGLLARPGAPPARPSAPARRQRWELAAQALAGSAVALVVARWILPTAHAYRVGILDDDSVAYHMPFAARFVQEGWLTDLHFAVPEIPMAFYPAGGELFHALGMLAFGDDLLSPGLNIAWLGLLLLAAYCLGRAAGGGVGVAAATVAAVAVIAGSPLVVTTQAGSAHIDVAGVALLLSAAALLAAGWREDRAVATAALAAGLAVATKYTFLLPAAALTVGVGVLAWRERRRALVAGWLGAGALSGGYWYLRNLFEAGSPLPPVRLELGSIGFPATEHTIDIGDAALVDYLDRPRVLWRVLHTAAFEAFGTLWPIVLLAVAAGIVVAIRKPRSPVHVMLGLVALVSAAGYFFIRSSAFGVDEPIQVYVTSNVRYALPALALGMGLLATSGLFERGERQLALTGVLTGLVLSMQFADTSIFSAWRDDLPSLPGVLAGLAVLVVTAAGLGGARGWVPRPAIVAAAAIAVVAGSLLVADRYGDHRYREDPSATGKVFSWAQDHPNRRIGVAGTFRHYPLYGPEQTNHVQYVGRIGHRHRFREVPSCDAWGEAVSQGGYDTIVTMPGREEEAVPRQAQWTRSALGAREALHSGKASVFEIEGDFRLSC